MLMLCGFVADAWDFAFVVQRPARCELVVWGQAGVNAYLRSRRLE